MRYCDESTITIKENSYRYDPIKSAEDYFYGNNIIYENGTLIKNCNFALTDEIIESCMGNTYLIRSSCILEGAKIDMTLKNFLKEGKDYKGLKKDLREIIRANDLDTDELQTDRKGFMHICKRILQVTYDLGAVVGGVLGVADIISAGTIGAGYASLFGGTAGAVMSSATVFIVIFAIISYVIGFIINRLIRFAVDSVEFNTLKKDCNKIVDQLEDLANKTNDKKKADKYRKEAQRLKDSIRKYDR